MTVGFAKKSKFIKLFLGVILLLQVLHIVYYANAKTSYHMDEMATHLQASGSSGSPLEYGKFIEGAAFLRALQVAPGEEWNFKAVAARVSDSHPPLYHWQVHAAQSLFPGVYSKWFAISINLFWFILSGILFFCLCKLFFKDELLALAFVLLYGFCPGVCAMVLYARMYVLAGFFALAFLYLVFRLTGSEKEDRKIYILLALTVFTGLLTHYYFIIWAFCVSAVFSLLLLKNKRYAQVRNYAFSVCAGVGVNLLIFPALQNILFSPRGREAAQNALFLPNLALNFIENFSALSIAAFGGLLQILAIVMAAAFLFTFFYTKRSAPPAKTFLGGLNAEQTGILVFAVALYAFIIAKVAPYNMLRYSYITLPMWLMGAWAAGGFCLRYLAAGVFKFTQARAARFAGGALAALAVLIFALNFTGQKAKISVLAAPFFSADIFAGLNAPQAVYIDTHSRSAVGIYGPVRDNFLDFANFKEVYILSYPDWNYMPIKRELEGVLARLDKSKKAVLFADPGAAWAVEQIAAENGWSLEKIVEKIYTDVFIISYDGGAK